MLHVLDLADAGEPGVREEAHQVGLSVPARPGMTATVVAVTVPETVPFGEATLKPLRGGETLKWKLA